MSKRTIEPGKHMLAPDTIAEEAMLEGGAQLSMSPDTDQQLDASYVSGQAVGSNKFSASNLYKRAKQAAVLATVGVGAYATVNEYAPNPKVSSAGTDVLIGTNEFLRDNGEAGLVAVAGIAGVIGLSRMFSPKAKEMLEMTKPAGGSREKHWSRKILPPLLVTATAVGTGLGAEAGSGANEPIDAMVSVMHADRSNTYAVVQHDKVLPFNHSAVSRSDVAEITTWSIEHDYTAAPFYMTLGNATNDKNTANPSSAGIISMPDSMVPEIATAPVDYGSLPILTTSQFAKVGEVVEVEGEQAQVVAVADKYPGLDRTSALTANSAYEQDVLVDGEPYFGVMVSGVDSEAEIDAFLAEHNIKGVAIPVNEWQERYNEFWDRSVTPVSMQFLLMIAGIGSVAAGFMRTSDILRRRRDLANQNIMGVDKSTEARAEYMRAFVDTAKATAYAAAPTVGFLALTNSSQYGMSLEANPAGLGAGAILVGGSLLASTVAAGRMIRKMDSANEVR